jgi:hypothetical protein
VTKAGIAGHQKRQSANVEIDNPAIQTTSAPVILSGAGVDALASNTKTSKSKFR